MDAIVWTRSFGRRSLGRTYIIRRTHMRTRTDVSRLDAENVNRKIGRNITKKILGTWGSINIRALAFVRLSDVPTAFEALQEYVDECLEPVMEYVEDNYVGRRRGTGRKEPRFKHAWWNVHDRTLRDEARTNNNAEAGFRRLRHDFSCSHPTIFKFIDVLRQLHRSRDLEYDQAENSVPPPAKKKKYAQVNDRIKKIVEDYDARSHIEFLRAIAHNL